MRTGESFPSPPFTWPTAMHMTLTRTNHRFLYITYSGENTFGNFESA
jgi:hypothetical protein